MPDFETVIYEVPLPGVAKITQNRADLRNAQNLQLTYDLNNAFDQAAMDDDIKVIIVAGIDPHFSSGHDMTGDKGKRLVKDFDVVSNWGGYGLNGSEGLYAREKEIYLEMTRRWRDIPKPTIAMVQGKCISGGLAIAWACDLIIASDDATFSDMVVNLGVAGIEYFAHPWEMGARKAKELLFTADSLTAEEAKQLGMVNHVKPREELESFTCAMAENIASKPSFALKMIKQAVNQTMDIMGQKQSMDAAFSLHQLCHAHNKQKFDVIVDPTGMQESWKKRKQAQKDAATNEESESNN